MTATDGHFVHRTLDGDRWDLLAHDWYGDATKDHILIKANRRLFVDTLGPVPPVLRSGLEIIIPVIDEAVIDHSHLPPWKRNKPDYGETP